MRRLHLAVPSSLSGAELSSPRRLEVPKGWKASSLYVGDDTAGAIYKLVPPSG